MEIELLCVELQHMGPVFRSVSINSCYRFAIVQKRARLLIASIWDVGDRGAFRHPVRVMADVQPGPTRVGQGLCGN